MKEIRTEDAVGHILCHDITQIIKDEKKGVLFKKGHVVKEEDIPLLLSVGKEHLFVWEKKEGILHENEAAEILYKICAGNSSKVHGTDIKEGKIEVISKIDGVLSVRSNPQSGYFSSPALLPSHSSALQKPAPFPQDVRP